MTPQEFQTHYKDLADAFGSQNFNAKRGSLLFKYVADLSSYWWRALVERMIIENNPKLNIAEAAAGERKAKKSIARAQEVSDAHDALLEHATGEGLNELMKRHDAKGLVELMTKMKGKGA